MNLPESGRPVRRIALVVHPDRPAAKELAVRARTWWEARGYEVIEDASPDGPTGHLIDGTVELAVSLGGDGTMLRTIALAAPFRVPTLGVNLGTLGYLTSIEPDDVEEAFGFLARNDFTVEEWMTLEIIVHHNSVDRATPQRYLALNEVVVERVAAGHTIRVAATIGDEPFLTYAADGILVATPTGSTAYNLSLRGPVVSPRLRAILLTPIAPHMLFDRTLVIEPSESVRLELLADRPAVAVIDGVSIIDLLPGDVVEAHEGPHPARVVSIGQGGLYKILRSKFGLTDR